MSNRKLTKTRDPKQTWEFQHPHFTRDSSHDQLNSIKRKTAMNSDPTRAELDMYRDELNQIRQQNHELRNENAQKDCTIKELKTKVTKLEDEIRDLRNQLYQSSISQHLLDAVEQQSRQPPLQRGYAQPNSFVNSSFNRPYYDSQQHTDPRLFANSSTSNTSNFRMSLQSDRSGSRDTQPVALHDNRFAFGAESRIMSDGSDVSLGVRSLSGDSQPYSFFRQAHQNGLSVGTMSVRSNSDSLPNVSEPNIVCTVDNICLRKTDISLVQHYINSASEDDLQYVVQTFLRNIVNILTTQGILDQASMCNRAGELTPDAKLKITKYLSDGTLNSAFTPVAAELALHPVDTGIQNGLDPNHPGKTTLSQLFDHFDPSVVSSCILPLPRMQRCLVRFFGVSESILEERCGPTQGNPQAAVKCLLQVLQNQFPRQG